MRKAATPTVDHVFRDESASDWLKSVLQSALVRDPVDALNDALLLASVLEEHLREILDLKS